jgi:hypothetical protein
MTITQESDAQKILSANVVEGKESAQQQFVHSFPWFGKI